MGNIDTIDNYVAEPSSTFDEMEDCILEDLKEERGEDESPVSDIEVVPTLEDMEHVILNEYEDDELKNDSGLFLFSDDVDGYCEPIDEFDDLLTELEYDCDPVPNFGDLLTEIESDI